MYSTFSQPHRHHDLCLFAHEECIHKGFPSQITSSHRGGLERRIRRGLGRQKHRKSRAGRISMTEVNDGQKLIGDTGVSIFIQHSKMQPEMAVASTCIDVESLRYTLKEENDEIVGKWRCQT
jgi:hypothetical protein